MKSCTDGEEYTVSDDIQNVEDRVRTYRMVISKFINGDYRKGRRVLNILRRDDELNDESRSKLVDDLFKVEMNDDHWFFIRLSDALTHQEEPTALDLFKQFVPQSTDHSSPIYIRIVKLVHGFISQKFRNARYESVNSWSDAAVRLADILQDIKVRNLFIELRARALFAMEDSSNLKKLYLQSQTYEEPNVVITYLNLLLNLKDPSINKETLTYMLSNVLSSKEPRSDAILKLSLYETLTALCVKEKDNATPIHISFYIFIIEEALKNISDFLLADRRVVLFQHAVQMYALSVEMIRETNIFEKFISFVKKTVLAEIGNLTEVDRIWFGNVLFNTGLSLMSDRKNAQSAYEFLILSGLSFYPYSKPTYQITASLAAFQCGLDIEPSLNLEVLISKAIEFADNLSSEELKTFPNIFSTLILKKAQAILKTSIDVPKKISALIDDCLQEPRLPGETMEILASMLNSKEKRELQRSKIRCLKAALNKPGTNRSDLNRGIDVFCLLIKELLYPFASEPFPLAEIKATVDKLVERLEEHEYRYEIFQDRVLYILGNLWNYSWKAETIDETTVVGEPLRDMARSLKSYVPNKARYLDIKLKT